MAADLYLRDGGVIAFVMPRSVLTGALHHVKFKEFRQPKMRLVKVYDFKGVEPLFNVPACALLAVKGGETRYPVPMDVYKGKLPEKNVRLSEAGLAVERGQYKPPVIPTARSYYHDKFKEGATLVPRRLCFVEFVVHETLHVDLTKPFVKSAKLKIEKAPWKGIELSGNVEAEFIYATLLAEDIVPFGHLPFRSVVLPIEPAPNGYRLLSVETLRGKGYNYMADWLEKGRGVLEDICH
jgi:hypothetical protein